MALRDWLTILMVGVIFGSTFMLNALLLPEMTPGWISAGRLAIAALACWIVALVLRKKAPSDPVVWLKLIGFGLVAYGIPFALFPLAQQQITSGTAGIINALTPVTTVLVSAMWPGGEKVSPLKGLGVLAGFAGAASLSLGGGTEGNSELWAIIVAIGATVLYAIAFNLARAFRALDPTVVGAIALTGGALGILPFALASGQLPAGLSTQGWAALLALGLFPTAFTALLMYRLLPRVGPLNFSLNTFITPIVAVLLGVTFLHEPLLPAHATGIFGVLLGLLLIDGRLIRRLQGRRTAREG